MGVNADGGRELLGIKVGDSRTETFWAEFTTSLEERGSSGVKLVISDAHVGLTKAIRRQLQAASGSAFGCTTAAPKAAPTLATCCSGFSRASQGMVTAALRRVFAQEICAEILSRWDDPAVPLAEPFPRAAALLAEAREDGLASAPTGRSGLDRRPGAGAGTPGLRRPARDNTTFAIERETGQVNRSHSSWVNEEQARSICTSRMTNASSPCITL
jgi:hypothetical protein